MLIDLKPFFIGGEKIAVAVSGGVDSMSLLHYMHNNARLFGISVIALNVEHGIRGETSLSDSEFVADYCARNGIELLSYSVDSIKKAKEDKLSIEQSARELRYACFEDAISLGKCDKVATAHHRDDNSETVLFNLFRGTGAKGLIGITKERESKIIRPFLSLDRTQIEEYAKANGVPYVTDETNACNDYTRNAIRHNVIPKIRTLFPEFNRSIERLSKTIAIDDEYLTEQAKTHITCVNDCVELALPCHQALIGRAVIMALKGLGITKDWEKKHIDDVAGLTQMQNGSKLSIVGGVTVVKEYSKLVFFRQTEQDLTEIPFAVGKHSIADKTVSISPVNSAEIDLKSGFYAALDKIPDTAIIRTRRSGDVFEKFGGGNKSLGDYLTDKKVPLRERDHLVLVADGNQVLLIFGIAVSNKVKVDKNTQTILEFSK